MASAGTAPARIPASSNVAQKTLAAIAVRRGASWFYWIAGLSLINSLVVIFGGNFHFVVGLGVTSVVDVLAKQAGNAGIVLDIVINGFVAGVFFLFGSIAGKAQKWAFVVGMALYTLDGLLLFLVKDFFSVAFHAYALFAIYRGLAAVSQLQSIEIVSTPGAPIEPR
jgi:hypothetical protein